jgi:starvation-inducible DNA-binding protein
LFHHLLAGMARPCGAITLNQQEMGTMNLGDAELRWLKPLDSPGYFETRAVEKISSGLTVVLADMFALYLKTKNFHWHISGPHFRDYHLLLDEQSAQILAATDAIAERVRKIGGTTLHSIGHIGRLQRIADNDREHVTARDMLVELREDNRQLTTGLRSVHALCDELGDVASASLIENWIDEAEHRAWFLLETTR